MVAIGFTGSREGMKDSVRKLLRDFLNNAKSLEFHHGDCKGSDEQFHMLLDNLNIKGSEIHVHPPNSKGYKANCASKLNNIKVVLHESKPYFDRNRDIVDSSDLIIATPKSLNIKRLGGTWWTIEYALEKNKPVMILL
jgi:hypothetical protein